VNYLVLSDLHGNWEALQSVLQDARGRYDRIVCCGDLVGYGPDPNRVVEWASENLHGAIRGNHDRACCGIDDLEWFNPIAQQATRWTAGQLSEANLAWLRALPPGPAVIGGFMLAHGSPLDEDEYLITLADAANIFGYLEANMTFFGHTHVQGGFLWRRGRREMICRPLDDDSVASIHVDPEGLYLVNPGSVGQPRDADPRAAYALYDPEAREVELRRVAYDHETVRQKIEAAGLPTVLGERLGFGR
jgi:diadenosine tetraphosphatase ApaH/serine/threonine PP2A family protein phosphatase